MPYRIDSSKVTAPNAARLGQRRVKDACARHSFNVHENGRDEGFKNTDSYRELLDAPKCTEMHKTAQKKGQRQPKASKTLPRTVSGEAAEVKV
jgi:hypothetical protein